MSTSLVNAMVLGIFALAGLRSVLGIRTGGWLRPFLTISFATVSLWATSRWNLGPFLSFVLGLICLFLVARPSRHARLTRRVQSMVSRLSEGLGLDIQTEVIPLRRMMESPQAKGLDESTAKRIVNAFAGQIKGKPFILFTPGAAALAAEELSFIAAHEIGHHALGHTRQGLLDKIENMITTDLGQLMTLGIGTIWKHFVAPRRSQSEEFEADEWATRRLMNIGLSAKGGVMFFNRIIQQEGNEFLHRLSTKLFGTHPPAADRRTRIQRQIEA